MTDTHLGLRSQAAMSPVTEQVVGFVFALIYTATVGWIVRSIEKKRDPTTPPSHRYNIGEDLKTLRKAAIFAVSGLALLKGVLWLAQHGDAALDWAIRLVGTGSTELVIALVVVGVGTGAYQFKKARQFEYGVVEIGFGGLATAVALANIDRTHFLNTLATAAGCVYVVSRGCNNVADGYDARAQRREIKRRTKLLFSEALQTADIKHAIELEYENPGEPVPSGSLDAAPTTVAPGAGDWRDPAIR